MSFIVPSRSFLDSKDITLKTAPRKYGALLIDGDDVEQLSKGCRLLRKIMNLREKYKGDEAKGAFFDALTELLRAEGVEFHEGDGLSL